MEHILTGPYNKPTNNSRRPPRGAYKITMLLGSSGRPGANAVNASPLDGNNGRRTSRPCLISIWLNEMDHSRA
ncbi:MAG: hypothetical protein ACMX3H_02125 [Sodalis sp. (in: enterobacteria)]|uniref:hypothetical protein n=1 Tax=Sodalis sp. (in: enterobacteria) TaxID=1898979 RepID=UPI0039E22FFC